MQHITNPKGNGATPPFRVTRPGRRKKQKPFAMAPVG